MTPNPGILERRRFLQGLQAFGALSAAGGQRLIAADEAPSLAWPQLTGSPVLDSLRPAIERSRDVSTHLAKIKEVSGWMAYEELPMPDYQMPFGIGEGSAEDVIDFILTADRIDTAFTDFSGHLKVQVDYAGRHWSTRTRYLPA